MTHPPQQNPSDPYGQQQPGGYQQPGYQQPQQPSYQQFPQQPYGAPGEYGQPPRKSPLPWILAGGGALVVAVVVVLIIVLTGGDGGGDSPRGTADALASALNDRDVNAINALMCDERDKIDPKNVADADLNELSNVRVKSVSEPKADKASAVLTATIDGKDDDNTFPMRKKDGKWCVGGSSDENSGDNGETGGASTSPAG